MKKPKTHKPRRKQPAAKVAKAPAKNRAQAMSPASASPPPAQPPAGRLDLAALKQPGKTMTVPLARIHLSPLQPRRIAPDTAEQRAFEESVAASGILQPVLLRPHPKLRGQFELVAGELRIKAARLAARRGRKSAALPVPALVKPLDDATALFAAGTENLQRRAMHPADECRWLHDMTLAGAAPAQLAEGSGLSLRVVQQRLMTWRKLSAAGRRAFESDAIGFAQAHALAQIPDEAVRETVLVETMRDGAAMNEDAIKARALALRAGIDTAFPVAPDRGAASPFPGRATWPKSNAHGVYPDGAAVPHTFDSATLQVTIRLLQIGAGKWIAGYDVREGRKGAGGAEGCGESGAPLTGARRHPTATAAFAETAFGIAETMIEALPHTAKAPGLARDFARDLGHYLAWCGPRVAMPGDARQRARLDTLTERLSEATGQMLGRFAKDKAAPVAGGQLTEAGGKPPATSPRTADNDLEIPKFLARHDALPRATTDKGEPLAAPTSLPYVDAAPMTQKLEIPKGAAPDVATAARHMLEAIEHAGIDIAHVERPGPLGAAYRDLCHALGRPPVVWTAAKKKAA